jgi:hypothetical protein
MPLLTFEQRNRLKVELYSGVTLTRKREILKLLEQDEIAFSQHKDLMDELGDQEF